MANPAKTVDQNLLPVQAYFNLDGTFNTFIGQNMPFYATVNPVQSGLTITNSTIDSSPIGATTPSTGVFTNVSATTGQISTTPSSNTDIANKFYVDTVAQGLGPKAACQVATTANITLSGLQTIDGYTTLAGDRVLVKNQSSSQYNGIYIASASTWTRSTDMDVWSEVPGAYTVILNGGQADTGWVCTATQSGTIDVTAMPWVQFSGANTYFAGTGLSLLSNTFSITNTGVSASTYGSASAVPVIAVNAQGQITSATTTSIAISNTQVSGLGTMSTQNANSVAITGGSINGTTIGASTASTISGTTITATTQFSGPGTGLTGTAASLNIGGNAATATFATSAGSASSATTATTATNLAGGASNSIPYQSAASTTTFLSAGTGVLQSNSGLSWTTSPSLVGTNFSSIPNGALTNSSITIGSTNIALGATASTLTNVTMATPTISSYETWTASSAPSYNAGRLWYDSTVNSLAYYNDVTNNTLHIGQEIQLKVYNNTGSTINIGQPVYVTSTSSGYTYPNVALAIANSLTTGNVIGLANQNIPTGTAGYVTTIGLIQGINTGSYTVGDTLYLSPYSAGFYQNTIPPTGYAIKLGTVAYVNSSNGSIYINKSILSVQAGNIVGQVALANGGTNANLTAIQGGIVYSGASALAISAAGTTGQFLQSNGTGAPTWATPVSYATVTDDTTTNGTRYPLFANQTSGNLTTEYTSSTKLQYNPSTGALSATSFVGTIAGSNVSGNISGNAANVTGTVAIANGGTGQTTASAAFNALSPITSTGDLIIGNGTNSATRLGIGTNGYILTSNGTTASWAAAPATGVTISDDTSSATAYYPLFARVTTGTVTTEYTSSTKLNYTPSTGLLAATSFSGSGSNLTFGTGTLSLAGNVTHSGAFTQSFTATANTSLTLPTSGYLISTVTNMAANPVTGTPSSSTYLRGDGTWSSVSATTANNLAGGALGSVPYQLLSGSTTFLAGNTTTTPQFLTSTGVAGIATAPTYTSSTGSGNVVLATSPTLVTPALGTPSAIVLTNATSVPVNQATGTLPVANGGTGLTSTPTNGQLDIGNGTGFTRATLTAGTGISVTNDSGAITITNTSTASPGGSNTQIQYNSSGAFAGSANLTFDGTNLKFNSGYGSAATGYGVRAWVNFAGSNGSINASGNVSSVTRNSTGNYTINFTNAMPDANYAVAGYTRNSAGTGLNLVASTSNGSAPTTTALRVEVGSGSSTFDNNYVTVMVVR
jgi:hypothetical protein